VSFTILRVTQRAHGGDPIERTKRIAGNEATIGRGTDCDLQLPDLIVGLRHAVIRITGPGRLTIEANGNHRFLVNGSIVRHADLRVADHPSVIFGSYVLTFGLGETENDIVVSVEQMASDVRDSDTSLAKKAFSLGSVVFGLRGAAWFLGISILLATVAAPRADY
jgi:pSer/pThr/pTyr-binding forkhead associated (FHA) protein